jgi:hypothetical protein
MRIENVCESYFDNELTGPVVVLDVKKCGEVVPVHGVTAYVANFILNVTTG